MVLTRLLLLFGERAATRIEVIFINRPRKLFLIFGFVLGLLMFVLCAPFFIAGHSKDLTGAVGGIVLMAIASYQLRYSGRRQ